MKFGLRMLLIRSSCGSESPTFFAISEMESPLCTTYVDFLMPTAMEIPEVEIVHTETPSPLNPLGVKGVGEAGAIPGPAVLAEAIEDALAPLGVRIREMPLHPDRIRELIASATTNRT